MKKLLILLFSILISFNSYGGGVDGKGLICKKLQINDELKDEWKHYHFSWDKVWFARPDGYSIYWYTYGLEYEEIGTDIIEFSDNHEILGRITQRLDRSTLIINTKDSKNSNWQWSCSLVNSSKEIDDHINLLIDAAKKTNKI